MSLPSWAQAAVDLLLPPLCLHCGAPLACARPALCVSCRGTIRPVEGEGCRRCRLPRPGSPPACARCLRWPAALTVVAATRHGGAAAAVVHALKYRGWRHLAETCAEAMDIALEADGMAPDLFVPVPLHAARRRARGFNQADLLAEALARRRARPVAAALERGRATRSQVGLGRAARLANVGGAFRARQRIAPHETIGLVDDVTTSGATLVAATETLVEAGATRVVGIAFALALDLHDR